MLLKTFLSRGTIKPGSGAFGVSDSSWYRFFRIKGGITSTNCFLCHSAKNLLRENFWRFWELDWFCFWIYGHAVKYGKKKIQSSRVQIRVEIRFDHKKEKKRKSDIGIVFFLQRRWLKSIIFFGKTALP